MKRLCTHVLFQWLFLDQISFEIKQKSKYKVNFNFIFILIEKKKYFKNILIFLEKIREPNQNFIAPAHVLLCTANLTFKHDDYFIARHVIMKFTIK